MGAVLRGEVPIASAGRLMRSGAAEAAGAYAWPSALALSGFASTNTTAHPALQSNYPQRKCHMHPQQACLGIDPPPRATPILGPACLPALLTRPAGRWAVLLRRCQLRTGLRCPWACCTKARTALQDANTRAHPNSGACLLTPCIYYTQVGNQKVLNIYHRH